MALSEFSLRVAFPQSRHGAIGVGDLCPCIAHNFGATLAHNIDLRRASQQCLYTAVSLLVDPLDLFAQGFVLVYKTDDFRFESVALVLEDVVVCDQALQCLEGPRNRFERAPLRFLRLLYATANCLGCMNIHIAPNTAVVPGRSGQADDG